jgi:hypothetical protein
MIDLHPFKHRLTMPNSNPCTLTPPLSLYPTASHTYLVPQYTHHSYQLEAKHVPMVVNEYLA